MNYARGEVKGRRLAVSFEARYIQGTCLDIIEIRKECRMPFKRILCAVDFSPYSTAAFREAVRLVATNRAELFLLHAIEVHPLVSQWMAPDGLSDLTMHIEEKAKESMEELQNSESSRLSGVPVHVEITSGRAFTEILENSRVWEADLIVMGAQGEGALEDIPLGSTIQRVLQDAPCSVLVVKLEEG